VHETVETEIGGQTIQLVTVEQLGESLIIGTDILEKLSGKIDYGAQIVWLSGVAYPFLIGKTDRTVGKIDFLETEFPEVMLSDQLTESRGLEPLQIKTEGDPIYQRAYRAPLSKRKVIEETVDEMLKQDIIEPSNSPWASPVTLVAKKDGSSRFCVDYRKLNTMTTKDKYPLPHIQDIFDTVGKGKVFSVLDLRSGYWQLPVAAEDRFKTAFTCHVGQFQYKRVSFGLVNGPSYFQRAVHQVFAPYLGRFVLIYIDDIVLYSDSEEEHVEHLRKVFECLSKHNLQLKMTKCSFMQPSVDLLGFRISGEGIAPLEEKVKAINDLPAPKNVKGVRSFLGLTNYYRQCVPSYANIAEPIVALTRKSVPFVWEPKCQEAFELLKAALVSPSVMAHPDVDRPYSLYTDACDYAVGGVLVQMDDQGLERPIQYISHQLSAVQRRWATIEKEAYALVYALQKLRPYLLGSDFTIYVDHKPLKCLFTKEMNNTKIQRWGILLAEYGAKIEYRKGIHNVRADSLSRLPSDSGMGEVEIAAIVEPDWATMPLDISDRDVLERLVDGQRAEYANLIAEAVDPDEDSDYILYRGVLFSEKLPHANAIEGPRLVLPEEFQLAEVERAHEAVGHMSVSKTLRRISEEVVWPGMRRSVQNFVRECARCAIFNRTRIHVPMQEVEIPQGPMQVVHLDFIGPYAPDPHGNRYVLMAIDYLTGWLEAYPTPNQSAREIIEAIATKFYPAHGQPLAFVADNGQGFGSRQWTEFVEQTGVESRHATPVHPQGNAKIERANRTLKEILIRLQANRPQDWHIHLPAAVGAYRLSVSDATGFSPFFLLYGRNPRPPCGEGPAVEGEFGNRLDNLAQARHAARVNIEQNRQYNLNRLERQANVGTSLRVGESVAVKAEERMTGTAFWDPGFVVTRVRGTTHWVNNPDTGANKKLHREKLKVVVGQGEAPPRPRRRCRPRVANRV
jgi:hypothetical protein